MIAQRHFRILTPEGKLSADTFVLPPEQPRNIKAGCTLLIHQRSGTRVTVRDARLFPAEAAVKIPVADVPISACLRYDRLQGVCPVALLVLIVVIQGIARADDPRVSGQSQQVWLISTRSAPRCGNLESGLEKITYQRLDERDGSARWLLSDSNAFRASGDPSIPTTVFIHGNWTGSDMAVRQGWSLCSRMRQIAAGRPFRMVIWSWPADRVVRGIRADVQLKVAYSDTESYYLARTLPSVTPGTSVSLVGFSLGCRVAGGALQLLAGGQAGGRRLSPDAIIAWTTGTPRPIRVMLIAAAVDRDWLQTSGREGMASLGVQRALVTQNGRDRALKFYSRLYRAHGPEALGYVGPAAPGSGNLEVVNVASQVGEQHDYEVYQSAPSVDRRIGWCTFLDDHSLPGGSTMTNVAANHQEIEP